MSDQSARLNLPFLMPSQAQKHITHNEALELLDALVQVGLASLAAETPPASPADGEMHALGAAPTGDWATHAGELAYWTGTGWLFLSPQTGWQAWDITGGQMCIWDGSAWVRLAQAPDQVDQLGIQTGADTTNRLAVQSPATLLTHDGAGHQLKINKAGASDTASLLFQSGWTGHAEMGLAGDNSLRVKVSDDGSAWTTAMVIAESGTTFEHDVTVQDNLTVENNCTITGNISPNHMLLGHGIAGGASAVFLGKNGDRFFMAPSNLNGGYNWGREFTFDPNGDAVWLAEGGFQTTGMLTVAEGNAAFNGDGTQVNVTRGASSAFNFLKCQSGGAADTEFLLAGDGNAYADGSWSSGGADYAEFFEWQDGNPDNDDRRGLSVVLQGDKIRLAEAGEEPVGVISATPTIVGDSDMDRWRDKYLRDVFGAYVWEDHEVYHWEEDGHIQSCAADQPHETGVPATATKTVQQRRRLNPEFDPARPYVPRAARREWAAVGLMGKLRLRAGCPVSPRWIKLGAPASGIETWLLR